MGNLWARSKLSLGISTAAHGSAGCGALAINLR